MKIRKTSIYDEFVCIEEKCPENCCRGWRIHIDDKTVQRYLEMKGLKGVGIRLCMNIDDSMPYFSRKGIRCPFLTLDWHCSIQRHIGVDLMPEICRRFPRDIRNYGPFTEYHLDLSCTHAAYLLLKNCGNVTLTESEGETDAPRYGDNDDMEFLESLCSSREQMLELFSVNNFRDIYELDGIFREAFDIAFTDHEKVLSCEDTGRSEKIPVDVFPLPVEILNDMINNSLYKEKLLYYSPFFYKLFKTYFRYFDKLTPSRGEYLYKELLKEFLEKYPEINSHTFQYIRYSLERDYLTTFEDYSFIKRILDALLCSNAILLLEAVYFKRYGVMTMEIEARIISLVERRARHNDFIIGKLADIFRFESMGYFSSRS